MKLSEYIERSLPIPGRTWPVYNFKERSYSRFAAFDIYDRIAGVSFDSPPWLLVRVDDPVDVVDSYIFEVDRLLEASEDINSCVWSYFMLYVAKTTAEDIRKLFQRIDNGKEVLCDG